jgi:predicted RNA-binding protein with PIN domain
VEPTASEPPVVLPDEVRQLVVGAAAEALSSMAPEQVPATLRAVARFTPAKRARLAAGGLAAALETDPSFRQTVAEQARERDPVLAEAVADGVPLPAAPPDALAAMAYLLRPPGWQGRLAAAAELLTASAYAAAGAAAADEAARLGEQLTAARSAARAEAERLRADVVAAQAETAAARQDLAALRRKVRDLGDRAAQAERRLAAAGIDDAAPGSTDQAASPAKLGSSDKAAPAEPDDAATPEPAPSDAELRRLRARITELEAALAAVRGSARQSRHAENVRLRVLVDSLVRAATGVQRELALPPLEERPADAVAAEHAATTSAQAPSLQGRSPDDPSLLDELLSAPLVHLLVDGYNVTKSGYGEQTLEVQRARLVSGLGALAARTSAEVTVVFDGVDRTAPVAAASPRGVRVLFSRTGETADDLLRTLVRAEPLGRALVVVTSDREIVDDVRADGAHTAPSAALLRLLER